MTRKKYPLADTDRALFQEAMKGIKKLKQSKIIPPPPASKQFTRKKEPLPTEEGEAIIFSDYDKLPAVGREEKMAFAKPGLQYKILRKLRQGQYNVEAYLDLHGKTIPEAEALLSRFLTACQKNALRNVLIIHGKGHTDKPILKNKLNHWLRQTSAVLAFYSALPQDGGLGALYVLLKKIEA